MSDLAELSEEEIERLWAAEAHRRLAEYRSGSARAVAADEVAIKAERLFQ